MTTTASFALLRISTASLVPGAAYSGGTKAFASIPIIQRYVGLTVAIENDGEGNQALYWFEKGISGDDFIALNIKSSFYNWEWLDFM